MTQDQAQSEMASQYPENIIFSHGTYDSEDAAGVFTDSEGVQWLVEVNSDGPFVQSL